MLVFSVEAGTRLRSLDPAFGRRCQEALLAPNVSRNQSLPTINTLINCSKYDAQATPHLWANMGIVLSTFLAHLL